MRNVVRPRALKIAVPLATLVTLLVLGACSLSLDGYAGPAAEVAESGADSAPDVAMTPMDAGREAASDAMTYQALVLSDSPLLYFRLGDGAQATSAKELVTGQLATFYGHPLFGVPGAIAGDSDTAVRLDGASGVLLTTNTGKLAGNVPYTLEVWVRPTSVAVTPVTNTGHVILSYEHGGHDGYSIYYYGDDFPRIEREYEAGVDTAYSGLETPLSAYSHVVGTYDGASLSMYVNGQFAVALASTAGIPGLLPSPFAIGGSDYADSNLFIGDIDEVAVYDHVLPYAEIKRHYEVGTAATP